MQKQSTHPAPSARALLVKAVHQQRACGPLRICFLLLIAFCGGLQIPVAASQQHDGTTADSAAPPAQRDSTAAIPQSGSTFIIGPEDVLAISVWNEPEITRSLPVRSDGKISLPLIGDVQAAGRTPMQLEQDIAARLKDYITNPQVAVIVQQINSQKFNILGQISKPGSFPLTADMTIVDAIAVAGGFKDFAKRKGVYLLRQNSAGVEERFNFNYDKFIKEKNTAQNIKIMPNDTIIVP